MLCQNCGQNEANVKYTQIINGVKEQMSLCDKCAKELEIEDIKFNMPISFSSFLGDIFDIYENEIPIIGKQKTLICDKCNMTYEQFLENGKFGCSNCYEIFKSKLDSILKNIHGSNRHIGRVGKFVKEKEINKNLNINQEEYKIDNKINKKEELNQEEGKNEKLEHLKERLKQEIKEERYEDAAKTRDEIRKCQKGRGILTFLCQKRASLMT